MTTLTWNDRLCPSEPFWAFGRLLQDLPRRSGGVGTEAGPPPNDSPPRGHGNNLRNREATT